VIYIRLECDTTPSLNAFRDSWERTQALYLPQRRRSSVGHVEVVG